VNGDVLAFGETLKMRFVISSDTFGLHLSFDRGCRNLTRIAAGWLPRRDASYYQLVKPAVGT